MSIALLDLFLLLEKLAEFVKLEQLQMEVEHHVLIAMLDIPLLLVFVYLALLERVQSVEEYVLLVVQELSLSLVSFVFPVQVEASPRQDLLSVSHVLPDYFPM